MQTGTILPYSAYRQLPESDPNKYEMLWGELFVSPSPRYKHQRMQVRLGTLLNDHVSARGLGVVVGPVDLYRDEVNYVQPDLSYFTAEQDALLEEEQAIRLVPPLVVEVISPSTAAHDRTKKRRWYGELGVREYWIVDLDAQTVEVIDLLSDTTTHPDPVRSKVLPDLALPRAAIFG